MVSSNVVGSSASVPPGVSLVTSVGTVTSGVLWVSLLGLTELRPADPTYEPGDYCTEFGPVKG